MGTAKAVVDRTWAALESGQLADLRGIFAPDAEMVMPGGMQVRGIEQIEPVLRAYFAAFPDLRHRVVSSVEAEDRIALELQITGTHTGTLMTPNGPIPATGRSVEWQSVDMITVADDKIASWHAYYDQLAFLGQLGLLPEPATA